MRNEYGEKLKGNTKMALPLKQMTKISTIFLRCYLLFFHLFIEIFVFCKKYHIFISQYNPHKNIQILMFKFRAIEDVAKKTDILNALKMR